MFYCFTYRELDLSSRTVAAYLQALGLVKGDKVAIMLPNVIQYTIVAVAVLRAGLILVNVNPLYTSRELEHQLQDAEAKAIFILENFAHTYCFLLALCKLNDYFISPYLTKVG